VNKDDITTLLADWVAYKDGTLTIIDFANVEKCKESTDWRIGIPNLQHLVRNFSSGSKELGIGKDILAGRLARDGLIDWTLAQTYFKKIMLEKTA